MLQLDAVSDAIQKVIDQVDKYAPAAYSAARHQVAVDATQAFVWAMVFFGVAALCFLVTIISATGYGWERRQYAKKLDIHTGAQKLEQEANAKRLSAGQSIDVYRGAYLTGPTKPDPETYIGFGLSSAVIGLLVMVPALLNLLQWWQENANPDYFAIQKLRQVFGG